MLAVSGIRFKISPIETKLCLPTELVDSGQEVYVTDMMDPEMMRNECSRRSMASDKPRLTLLWNISPWSQLCRLFPNLGSIIPRSQHL
jgi:hypothetical protein